MGFRTILGQRFNAVYLMASIVLLQICMASVSPHKLSEDMSFGGGANSYIRAMDMNSDNALAPAEPNGKRLRMQAFFAFLMILRTVTERLRGGMSSWSRLNVFHTWDLLIGRAQSAAPQADMVLLN